MSRFLPFHGGNKGSNPLGDANKINVLWYNQGQALCGVRQKYGKAAIQNGVRGARSARYDAQYSGKTPPPPTGGKYFEPSRPNRVPFPRFGVVPCVLHRNLCRSIEVARLAMARRELVRKDDTGSMAAALRENTAAALEVLRAAMALKADPRRGDLREDLEPEGDCGFECDCHQGQIGH
jgi:hypothetical protein